MAGLFAIFFSFLAFVVAVAVPLFVQRWRTLAIVVAGAVIFFGWLTWDLARPDNGNWIGPFIGGLMLFGFAGGLIAKFVMLVGQRVR
ncbi:hypothetical protein [Devosia sp.]|uniref:hypothetical protein n=1 Tax=Devosia sp. TaxID=1871048 RepID=UPI003A901A99